MSEAEFKKYTSDECSSYREELKAILAGDVDALYEDENIAEIAAIREAYDKGELKIDGDIEEYIADKIEEFKEEREQSVFNYLNENLLCIEKLKSGFATEKFFDQEYFDPDRAYAILPRAIGGPSVYYVIGSGGDVYLSYNYGSNKHFEYLGNNFENSELYEFVELATDYKFGKNEFEIDEEEQELRDKAELGYDSVAEYLNQNLSGINEFLIEKELLIEYLDKNNLNINDTAEAILTEGAYNCWYYGDDGDMVDTTREQFVAEFEHFAERLGKMKNNSDFEDFVSVFGIDEDGMEFEADYIEDELNAAFPEQKVKNKNKPRL